MIRSKKFILYTVVMIILGALIARGFNVVGLWWTLIVLAVYSAIALALNYNTLRNFKRKGTMLRVRALIAAVIAFFTAVSLFTKDIPYFAILALLAIEYLYRDKTESNG